MIGLIRTNKRAVQFTLSHLYTAQKQSRSKKVALKTFLEACDGGFQQSNRYLRPISPPSMHILALMGFLTSPMLVGGTFDSRQVDGEEIKIIKIAARELPESVKLFCLGGAIPCQFVTYEVILDVPVGIIRMNLARMLFT
eukprot:m.46779 g.46779  ORF g.46779 m.46779 type:complete len:140 (+) comp10406_c0_seq1:1019-1438(+)